MSPIDLISSVVEKLCRKYRTRDPYELCKALGVKIRLKDLGTDIKAYYFYQSRISNIVLNWNVSESVRLILTGHELGHDQLHRDIAKIKGFQETELFVASSPNEYEANVFAAELLIDEKRLLLLLNDDVPFFDMAMELDVPPALLDFKFRVMKHKGYPIEAPYIAHGDFLKNDIDGCFEQDN